MENYTENGFTEKDRKALLVACSFFLVIIFLCWGGMFWKHVNRERTVTLENYHDYVSVYVDRNTSNGYELEYSLIVKGKKNISDFKIVVEVQLQPIVNGEQKTKTVEIERDKLYKDIKVKQFIATQASYYECSFNVLSISGRL